MRLLRREITKQARGNRQDDKAFLQFAREEKRRKLECRLRELREEMTRQRLERRLRELSEEMTRMGPVNKEVKS